MSEVFLVEVRFALKYLHVTSSHFNLGFDIR